MSTEFDDMSRAAIAAVVPDHILLLDEIGSFLGSLKVEI